MTAEASAQLAHRPRILFVTEHLPVPVRGGSSQRSHLLIEGLSRFADVELVAIGPPGVAQLLTGHGYHVAGIISPDSVGLFSKALIPFSFVAPSKTRYRPRRDALAIVRSLWETGNYDLVIGRYCRPSARVGVHRLSPAIIDIDDLDSQKILSWLASRPLVRALGLPVRWLTHRIRQAEQAMVGCLSRAWLTAAEDCTDLSADRIDVIPNIPFYPSFSLGPSPSSGPVLFVASFDFRINTDALRGLLRNIWPAVRAGRPDLMLRIVGGGLPASDRILVENTPGVSYAGFVNDLTAEYAAAMCCIVPIWQGGGTKIKILEGLALGRTCVVATPSLRGYADYIVDGHDLLVASDETGFVDAILQLANNETSRHRMETSGQNVVNANFSRDMLAKLLQASVALAIGRVD